MCYSTEDTSLAFSLFYRSPSCDDEMQKLVSLLHRQTLHSLLPGMHEKPGFSEDLFVMLAKKLEHVACKYVILCFDEMSIKEHLLYDKNQDFITGLEDFGASRSHKRAMQALVSMAKGLTTKWQQPLAFSLHIME